MILTVLRTHGKLVINDVLNAEFSVINYHNYLFYEFIKITSRLRM